MAVKATYNMLHLVKEVIKGEPQPTYTLRLYKNGTLAETRTAIPFEIFERLTAKFIFMPISGVPFEWLAVKIGLDSIDAVLKAAQ